MKLVTRTLFAVVAFALTFMIGCGGGGSGTSFSGPSGGVGQSQSFIITTTSLPGALQGHAYSTTLTATGGQSPYHWTMAPLSSTTLFVDGLTIDPTSGVISGTATFLGVAWFRATVTDSGSPQQGISKDFTIQANTPLSIPAIQSAVLTQYSDQLLGRANFTGGIPPFTVTIANGCLPTGVKSNVAGIAVTPGFALLKGPPLTTGVYHCNLTVQDSLIPPELGTQLLTITVVPPTLQFPRSLPTTLLLGRPFSGKLIAIGGTPPYSFALGAGTLPPGLNAIDPNTGQVSGTPTTSGIYGISFMVSDSSQATAQQGYVITVSQPLGRNDSPATATPIGNGSAPATISPYIDPPSTPTPGDTDYFKLVSLGGAIVHVETMAKRMNSGNPLDTVLEIVDSNGHPLATCRQPGDTGTTFTSPCINDDLSLSPHIQDSALDFQVAGATNLPTTFYAHVLDWRGDARPDMNYFLNVLGVVPPMTISTSNVVPAPRGNPYLGTVGASNGSGAITWSVDSGSLPPGISLSSTGSFSGAATVNGTYPFTLRATDSANPPQSLTASTSIEVVDPLTFTSPATWPDACQSQPYSFAVQTSGGASPVNFISFQSFNWTGLSMHFLPGQNTYDGVFTGTPLITGTFVGTVTVTDATKTAVRQTVTVTVKTCP